MHIETVLRDHPSFNKMSPDTRLYLFIFAEYEDIWHLNTIVSQNEKTQFFTCKLIQIINKNKLITQRSSDSRPVKLCSDQLIFQSFFKNYIKINSRI
jgi:hypothetical protein